MTPFSEPTHRPGSLASYAAPTCSPSFPVLPPLILTPPLNTPAHAPYLPHLPNGASPLVPRLLPPSHAVAQAPARSVRAPRSRKDRPCDHCRRLKHTCQIFVRGKPCTNCLKGRRECTFLQPPIPRHRRSATRNRGGGETEGGSEGFALGVALGVAISPVSGRSDTMSPLHLPLATMNGLRRDAAGTPPEISPVDSLIVTPISPTTLGNRANEGGQKVSPNGLADMAKMQPDEFLLWLLPDGEEADGPQAKQ